jgi:hypothetical protein
VQRRGLHHDDIPACKRAGMQPQLVQHRPIISGGASSAMAGMYIGPKRIGKAVLGITKCVGTSKKASSSFCNLKNLLVTKC